MGLWQTVFHNVFNNFDLLFQINVLNLWRTVQMSKPLNYDLAYRRSRHTGKDKDFHVELKRSISNRTKRPIPNIMDSNDSVNPNIFPIKSIGYQDGPAIAPVNRQN